MRAGQRLVRERRAVVAYRKHCLDRRAFVGVTVGSHYRILENVEAAPQVHTKRMGQGAVGWMFAIPFGFIGEAGQWQAGMGSAEART